MTTLNLSAIYGLPGAPGACAAPCPCPNPVAGGNGLGPITPGEGSFAITAISALQAYRVCAIANGGIRYATNLQPGDQNLGLFLTLAPIASGALGPVMLSGPVTNVITGSGGWAWTIGLPVYLSQNGDLTQTAPTTGFVRAVGVALSSNTIAFFPQGQYGAFAQSPRVVVVPYASTIAVDSPNIDIADITLVGNTTITLANGYDGQLITVRFHQDSTGNWTVTLGAGVVATFTMSTAALSTKQLRLQFYAAESKWIQV